MARLCTPLDIFFSCYAVHRDLHSFPTRRSSDLAPKPATTAATSSGSITFGSSRELGSGTRSEEHTSELQSRFELVCRLLLEKKKSSCSAFIALRGSAGIARWHTREEEVAPGRCL